MVSKAQIVHSHVPGAIQARDRTLDVRHTLSAPGFKRATAPLLFGTPFLPLSAHRQLKRASVLCERSTSKGMHAPLPCLCTTLNFHKSFRVFSYFCVRVRDTAHVCDELTRTYMDMLVTDHLIKSFIISDKEQRGTQRHICTTCDTQSLCVRGARHFR